MKLYHGTDYRNLGSILHKGLLKSIFEGGVYLTDTAESAVAWTAMRVVGMGGSQVLVCEVEVDENNLQLGCDHSPLMQRLFGCGESYVHKGDIPKECILNYTVYGNEKNV